MSSTKLHQEYIEDLSKIENGNGKVSELFKTWYDTWMPVNQINNYLEANSKMKTEINYRYSYALASIVFAIIGIPLGIRAHRSEKTIGFLICLGLIAVHYALVISVTAFDDIYVMRPDLLVWFPDILFTVTGAFLLWKQHKYS